jgi:hypothetical protein
MEFTIKPLTMDTWVYFEELVEKHNGVWEVVGARLSMLNHQIKNGHLKLQRHIRKN